MGKLHGQDSDTPPKGSMMGRWAFNPEGKDRAYVESMTAYGCTQEEIAAVLGITVKTLGKHFRNELDTAVAKANSKVAESLFNKAVNDKDTAAMIFWLKTRARWKETSDMPPGGWNIVVVNYAGTSNTAQLGAEGIPALTVEGYAERDEESGMRMAQESG